MHRDAESSHSPAPPHQDHPVTLIDRLRKIPCFGIAFAFASGFCFATASFSVELMRGDSGKGIDASLVVAGRSLVQFVFYLPVALVLKVPLLGVPGERFHLFLRSFFGFICFSLTYYSFAYVSLSDASSIAFSAPVFVAIFACLILREPCGLFQIGTTIITLAGVTMIARPAFLFPEDQLDLHFHRDERIIGTILSFAASLSMAYTFVLIRGLQRTPTATVVTYFSCFCVFAGGITSLILHHVDGYTLHVPMGTWDFCLMFLNGLCGAAGQTLLVISLKMEQASLVSLARTFDIVMAFIYQAILLKQSVTIMSVVGALLILSSCAACALKKLLEAKPEVLDRILCRVR